jgi:hypothetical protein
VKQVLSTKEENAEGQGFTTVIRTRFAIHGWSRKVAEALDYKDTSAGKVGPVAWQSMTPADLEGHENVTLELDSKGDNLVTVG